MNRRSRFAVGTALDIAGAAVFCGTVILAYILVVSFLHQ